ncbi:mechanosensitive ion channel family protein [Haloarchaeobius sp. DYHT-AS-18]|uniref:mechanosensitive ion channel family protein n=1 Tax=Haloarchaeobius sp. DYHT-AS-18 TaxID=3446117 RepID=UPI003EBA0F73
MQQVPLIREGTTSTVLTYLTRVAGALMILLEGWVVGRLIAGLIRRLVDAVRLDQTVLKIHSARSSAATDSPWERIRSARQDDPTTDAGTDNEE